MNGEREGAWQSVTLRDRESAKTFKGIVEARGHRLSADAPEVKDLSILTGVRVPRVGGPTFGEVAQRYLDSRTSARSNTIATYERIVRLHLAAWSDTPIAQITSDDVSALMGRLVREGKSVAAIFDLARSIFRYATNTEPPIRAGNPCAMVRVPRKRQRTQTFLTQDEAALILASCDEVTLPVVETFLGTGLRFAELAGLTVGDLHLTGKQPTLTVRQQMRRAQGDQPGQPGPVKSQASERTIALAPDTAAMLRQQAKGKPLGALVFLAPNGRPWENNRWQTHWNATVARAIDAGLTKRPRTHDLRHTHASWLLSDGIPLLTVSRRLGHESIAITAQTYGHIRPEADDQIRAALTARRASMKRGKGLRSV